MLLEFSIQKFKEAEFFNELTIQSPFEFICFFANTYREVVMLLEFSIQKSKEAEFFTRTDNLRQFAKRVFCALPEGLIISLYEILISGKFSIFLDLILS